MSRDLYSEFCLLTIQKHAAHTSPPPRCLNSVPQEKLLLISRACCLIEFVFVHFIFVLAKSGLGSIYMGETYLKNIEDH